LLKEFFAQLGFIIAGRGLRADGDSISGQHLDAEVTRRKPLDLFNKIRGNTGAGSIDTVTTVTG